MASRPGRRARSATRRTTTFLSRRGFGMAGKAVDEHDGVLDRLRGSLADAGRGCVSAVAEERHAAAAPALDRQQVAAVDRDRAVQQIGRHCSQLAPLRREDKTTLPARAVRRDRFSHTETAARTHRILKEGASAPDSAKPGGRARARSRRVPRGAVRSPQTVRRSLLRRQFASADHAGPASCAILAWRAIAMAGVSASALDRGAASQPPRSVIGVEQPGRRICLRGPAAHRYS
jgi:hypothetical protein